MQTQKTEKHSSKKLLNLQKKNMHSSKKTLNKQVLELLGLAHKSFDPKSDDCVVFM